MSFAPTREESALEKFGIKPNDLSPYQVLVLPENVFRVGRTKDLFESGDSGHFAKLLSEGQVKCATVFDFGLDVPLLERRSHDHRLGVIWVRDAIVLPVVLGILSSLIANQISNRSDAVRPKVHVDLYISRGPNVTKLWYEGDSETLVKILKTMEASNQP